jgi:large subunit ribosomal protein L29
MSEITAKDLRGNEPDELRNTARKLQEDLFKHRMKRVTNQLENTMLLRHVRRDIARVNTVLGEKLRAAAAASVPAPAAAPVPKAAKTGPSKTKSTQAKEK